jgi:hypothetical protein
MFMTALADRRAHGAQTWGLHASHTGEDIAEEEMFSADEQPDFDGLARKLLMST